MPRRPTPPTIDEGAEPAAPAHGAAEGSDWTFLTNHGHLLLAIADDPQARVEELARRVGITERSARRIIGELEAAGYVSKERVGRNNRYRIHAEQPLRHPVEKHRPVSDIIALVRR